MPTRKLPKVDLPPWQVFRPSQSPITIDSIKQMPEGTYGFIYRLTFLDGMMYIGKKNLYSTRTLAVRKSGEARLNADGSAAERIYRNTGKGFRKAYEVVNIESDWKTYLGSHKGCKVRFPKTREILHYAFNKLQLTYLEAKYLFIYEVLENPKYINDNILGSFYRGNFYDTVNGSTEEGMSESS